MYAIIFQPLIDVAEAILRFYHDTVGVGWGFSIVMLTVTVRLAILPLTFKQVRSMQAMQRLQPQMKELQARYKQDRQRMNEELMKLYQEHQVNPLGSCLPLLLQLPFFLSLFYLQQSEGFRALVRETGGASGVLAGGGSLDQAHAISGGEKFLFIPDLTVAPTGGVLVVLIIIYILTQLGSSTVSAQAMTDTNQKRLMFALPFLFVPFIISFPAGLLVYWITTNSWTVGQQLLIRKVLPPPHLKKDAKDAPAGGDEGGGDAAKSSPTDGAPAEKRGLGKILSDVAAGGRAAASDRAEARAGGAAKTRGTGNSGSSKASGGRKSGGGAKAGGAKAGGAKAGGAKAGGAKAAGAKRSSGAGNGAKAEKKSSSGDGGNGGPRKAPPPSPRKKKKRSGRRR
jgi:YidC/Oxa1 family membrane protein insertase